MLPSYWSEKAFFDAREELSNKNEPKKTCTSRYPECRKVKSRWAKASTQQRTHCSISFCFRETVFRLLFIFFTQPQATWESDGAVWNAEL